MLLFFTLSALAEEPQAAANPEFKQLPQVLKTNDKIIVTSVDGTKAEGRLTEISTDRIVLRLEPGNDRSFSASQVARVQRLKNGVLLGALIGLGASIPLAVGAEAYANNEGGSGGAVALGFVAGGTAIGIGIDALIVRPHTVYKRATGKRVTALPTVNRSGVGLKVALTF